MHTRAQDQLIFHVSGKRQGEGLLAIEGLGLRPALLARYRELCTLRHDFPIVLDEKRSGADCVQSLSRLVDQVLHDVAPRGVEGERLRRHALQLESEIRRAVDGGTVSSLGEMWQAAAEKLGQREGETLEQVLVHAAGALRSDGQVLGCSHGMPTWLITHAWRAARRDKARRFHAERSGLQQKLSDILRAADSHSMAGRRPESLKAALGGPHRQAFDFDALSRIVGKGAPRDELSRARRERIQGCLSVLEGQRFFAPDTGQEDAEAESTFHGFIFDSCAAAAKAFSARLDEVVALVKAFSVAELEVHGRYVEADHDLPFEAFGAHSLTAEDLARFPDYLVCVPPDRNEAPENANLMEMLSSGLPVKVLVQTTELLEDNSIGTGRYAFGVRSARLATTAMGLGGMFVLQSSSANLYAMRERIAEGLACRGPALFSVYAGSAQPAVDLPPYLTAAAAMQSRAFPAFSYDAARGSNWATRFSLENNPDPAVDWAVETLDYADAAQQRVQEPSAFTFADFLLCDARWSAHFALVPRARWHADMLPVADWLALDETFAAQKLPYVCAADPNDGLQRLIVDARLMQATRRCLLLWRRLQEHAAAPGTRSEEAAQPNPAPVTAAAPAAPDVPPTASAEHSRDEAWIDTARCPSCNECQMINDRMFGYDERKQAYIKDLAAGSYRQLVEAAESCQVAIIHPGKPRDPKEPGLEELLARAEPFR